MDINRISAKHLAPVPWQASGSGTEGPALAFTFPSPHSEPPLVRRREWCINVSELPPRSVCLAQASESVCMCARVCVCERERERRGGCRGGEEGEFQVPAEARYRWS